MQNTMKKIGLIVALCLLAFAEAVAQEIQPFEFKYQRGEKLDEDILQQLFKNTWTPYRQYHVENGQARPERSVFFALKFLPENDFEATTAISDLSGAWRVMDKRSLRMESVRRADKGRLRSLSGVYEIYDISDNQLVLVRDIGDSEKFVYYCKGNTLKRLNDEGKLPDQPEAEAAQAARKRRLLKAEIRVEMMLRGERWKRKYEDFSNQHLEVMLEQVLQSGEYDKKEALKTLLREEFADQDASLPEGFETMRYGQLRKLKKAIEKESAKKDNQ